MRFKRILGLECELADYRIQSITQGQDALAHVHVELKEGSHQISGFGVADESLCPCSREIKISYSACEINI